MELRNKSLHELMLSFYKIQDTTDTAIITDDESADSFTIGSLLRGKFYIDYLQDKDIPWENFKRKTIEEINILATTNKVPSFDSYRKFHSRHLRDMLMHILGEEECNKFYGLKNRALLSEKDCAFFSFLVDTYDDENFDESKYFLRGEYHKLDDFYVDAMHEGIIEFANNKNIGFDAEKIVKKWDMRFSRTYRDITEAAEKLRFAVTRFDDASYSEDMLKFYEKAKEEINSCADKLIEIGKEIFHNYHDEETEQFIKSLYEKSPQSSGKAIETDRCDVKNCE